ncbi:hypothetical protein Lal_00015785 [Lupinus albus]|nr:hypothetical protein Lal_00015785 [Lupinus albus]
MIIGHEDEGFKNKIEFLDEGFMQPPLEDTLNGPWKRCNSIVLSWIHHATEESIVKSILWFDTTAQVWKDLRDRFSQGDIFKVGDLLQEFYHLHQGNLTISEFFNELKTIWEEIETFRPTRKCKCITPCPCGIFQDLTNYREYDYVIRFLKGLNEKYAQVRSQIMLMDPLPHISKAFSMFIQQERQINITLSPNLELDPKALNFTSQPNRNNNNSSTTQAFRGRGNRFSKGRGNKYNNQTRQPRYCTYCDRTNHTIETCFLKHGYPLDTKPLNLGWLITPPYFL